MNSSHSEITLRSLCFFSFGVVVPRADFVPALDPRFTWRRLYWPPRNDLHLPLPSFCLVLGVDCPCFSIGPQFQFLESSGSWSLDSDARKNSPPKKTNNQSNVIPYYLCSR